jgi:hypothetical protein
MTPAQLVKAVSLALDVPEETVATHDRNLVTAGLRTTGARGVNAPDMTPRDAARLVVAILGSVRVKDSARTVLDFEKTKYDALSESDLSWLGAKELELAYKLKFFSDETLAALPADHNFIQALEALITRASAPPDTLDDFLEQLASMTIFCAAPSTKGEIGRTGDVGSAEYRLLPGAEPQAGSQMPGITQARTTTGTAIMLLGKAFRDNGLPLAAAKKAVAALHGLKKAPAKAKESPPMSLRTLKETVERFVKSKKARG